MSVGDGVLPDAELILTELLGASRDLPPAERFDDALPFLLVQRVGGGMRHRGHMDLARADVTAYARTPREANALLNAARATVFAARHTQVGGAVIASVGEELGPSERPDPEDSSYTRVACTLTIDLRVT